jgi:hypothetical protein
MGRILKLLTSALEQSKGTCPSNSSFLDIINVFRVESGMLSLGEAGELSPNASVMLRISSLSAWAELQVASTSQDYLKDVVRPHQATLGSLWVSSLRDYASVKSDSELFQDSGPAAIEAPYASLGKEVLLPVRISSFLIE